ncbi:cleavage stimulating factor 64-like isoform X1 [Vitis riparia]|uniref:cleavage stimulating factor 64-like isoform X1 n=1 Tax=Vitis riparia TaxID=96939 RepID=UPI00155A3314|nr:cleavage stimulating factor 64-like isoform X1 [Vitis riparia]
MLGMVTPQVLQMPNIRQASVPPTQPVLQDGQQGQQLAVQTLSGLPPLAQSKMQLGLMPKGQEGQVSAMPHNSLVHSQFSALPQQPAQPQIQLPPQGHNQALQQATFAGQSGVTALPSVRPQPPAKLPVRPQIQVASSSSLKHQMQPPLLQQPGQFGSANSGHNSQLVIPNATLRPTLMTRPSFPDPGFQPGSSTFSSIPETTNNNADRSSQVTNNTYSNMPSGLSMKKSMARDTSEPMNHPSKMVKLDDGRRAPFSTVGLNLSTSSAPASGPSQVLGIGSVSANQISKAEEVQHMDKKAPQMVTVNKRSSKYQMLPHIH